MGTFQSIYSESEPRPQAFIQSSLEIGKEDDEHEVEANSVADKVMKMSDPEEEEKVQMMAEEGKVQCMADDEEEKVQMMPEEDEEKVQRMRGEPLSISRMANGSESGMLAPQNVEEGINRSKGNGQSLSTDLQEELGGKMDADFSGVKVHTDDNAVQMNKEVGAKAFTHGNDVYFNKGQYNPTSNQGKHLLAHELTHTIQQNSSIQRKKIQRQTAKTDFGEFETTKFATLATNNGVEIILKFHPDDKVVDAKQIALSQSVKTVDGNKKNYAIDPNQRNRMVGGKGAGSGYYIDQMGTTNNPIYFNTKNLIFDDTKKKINTNEELKDTPQSANTTANPTALGVNTNYEIGHCYKINSTDANKSKHDAGLWDKPAAGKNVGESKTFETVAYATEGTQKGKYYGSVKWGYKITGTTAAPTVTTTDITVASKGIPTQNFIEPALLWNKGKMRGTLKVTANPATVLKAGAIATVAKDTKLRQTTGVTATGMWGKDPVIEVETLDIAGVGTGTIVYIKVADAKDIGDGAENKNLSLTVTTAEMLMHPKRIPESNVLIPKRTVVNLLDPVLQYFGPLNIGIKILSGPYAGREGFISRDDARNVKNEGDL